MSVFGSPRSSGPSPDNDLAAAIRRLADLMVGREIPDEALADAAAAASRLADDLERAAVSPRHERFELDADVPPQDYFPTSPVVGYANPLSAPADIWAVEAEDGGLEMRGRVTFGYAFEGPPTCVHGGVIAQLFDELLGTTNIMTHHGAMTGTLTIRYRRPTPLLTALDLEARLVGVEGRKVRLWGAIRLQGEITAEAEGLFIEPRAGHMVDTAQSHASVVKEALGQAPGNGAAPGQMARSRPSQ
jgi:acyl-coenzyme A thioesterase PaaI-like protein